MYLPAERSYEVFLVAEVLGQVAERAAMVAIGVRLEPDTTYGVAKCAEMVGIRVRLKADTTHGVVKRVRNVRLEPDRARRQPDYFPAGTTAMASISSSSSGRAR